MGEDRSEHRSRRETTELYFLCDATRRYISNPRQGLAERSQSSDFQNLSQPQSLSKEERMDVLCKVCLGLHSIVLVIAVLSHNLREHVQTSGKSHRGGVAPSAFPPPLPFPTCVSPFSLATSLCRPATSISIHSRFLSF